MFSNEINSVATVKMRTLENKLESFSNEYSNEDLKFQSDINLFMNTIDRFIDRAQGCANTIITKSNFHISNNFLTLKNRTEREIKKLLKSLEYNDENDLNNDEAKKEYESDKKILSSILYEAIAKFSTNIEEKNREITDLMNLDQSIKKLEESLSRDKRIEVKNIKCKKKAETIQKEREAMQEELKKLEAIKQEKLLQIRIARETEREKQEKEFKFIAEIRESMKKREDEIKEKKETQRLLEKKAKKKENKQAKKEQKDLKKAEPHTNTKEKLIVIKKALEETGDAKIKIVDAKIKKLNNDKVIKENEVTIKNLHKQIIDQFLDKIISYEVEIIFNQLNNATWLLQSPGVESIASDLESITITNYKDTISQIINLKNKISSSCKPLTILNNAIDSGNIKLILLLNRALVSENECLTQDKLIELLDSSSEESELKTFLFNIIERIEIERIEIEILNCLSQELYILGKFASNFVKKNQTTLKNNIECAFNTVKELKKSFKEYIEKQVSEYIDLCTKFEKINSIQDVLNFCNKQTHHDDTQISDDKTQMSDDKTQDIQAIMNFAQLIKAKEIEIDSIINLSDEEKKEIENMPEVKEFVDTLKTKHAEFNILLPKVKSIPEIIEAIALIDNQAQEHEQGVVDNQTQGQNQDVDNQAQEHEQAQDQDVDNQAHDQEHDFANQHQGFVDNQAQEHEQGVDNHDVQSHEEIKLIAEHNMTLIDNN